VKFEGHKALNPITLAQMKLQVHLVHTPKNNSVTHPKPKYNSNVLEKNPFPRAKQKGNL
jgi:hypothetical protein